MASRKNSGLEQLVTQFNNAFQQGKDWFNFFADDATIYTIDSTEPFKGRAAYEKNFKKLLKEKRQVNVLKRDIQEMGETAVVMQLVEVTQSDIATVFRESTIWRQEDGGWRVVHMHTALAASPRPAKALTDARSIKVLAGRIATVSAQVGVAQ